MNKQLTKTGNQINKQLAKTGNQINKKLVDLTAEGAARSTELVADAARRSADRARDWADDVTGRRTRRIVGRTAGVGLVAALIAVAAYLFWSSEGKKRRKDLVKTAQKVAAKAS